MGIHLKSPAHLGIGCLMRVCRVQLLCRSMRRSEVRSYFSPEYSELDNGVLAVMHLFGLLIALGSPE